MEFLSHFLILAIHTISEYFIHAFKIVLYSKKY